MIITPPFLRAALPGAGATYSSTFPLTENPISESGMWHHTDSLQTNVQTTGGRAFGTQDGTGGFDDSNAYVTGFGANYEIEATIYLNPSHSGTAHREVELLLRWFEGTLRSTGFGDTHCNGYEVNVAYDGAYLILGRFKGAQLGTTQTVPTPASGDKFRARVEGTTDPRIRVWWNDVLKFDITDTDAVLQIQSGNPGIGFYIDGGAPQTDYGFEDILITPL